MPTFVPTSFAGPGTAFSLGGIGDNLFLLDDRYLISTDDVGIRAFSNNSLDIHGTVHGFRSGIVMGEEIGGGSLFVGDSGSVSSSTFGAVVGYGNSNGYFNDVSIVNNGEIVTQSTGGQGATGVPATIHLSNNTLLLDEGTPGTTFSVVNSGLIANESDTLRTHAIRFDAVTDHAQIHNAPDGVISNLAEGIAAIQVGGVGYVDKETGRQVETTVDVMNAGTIFSSGLAYQSTLMHENEQERHAIDHFTNTGEVFGDIRLGTGDDRYNGRDGYIDGVVYGEDGNDVLVGGGIADHLDGGSDNDVLRGGAGDDHLDGGDGAGSDSIYAGEGNDTVTSQGGSDVIYGYTGDDVIDASFGSDLAFGGDGNDLVDGGGGSDTLYGGDGDDTVLGDRGQDILRGGDGDDMLDGGTERDELLGGRGNDTLTGGSQADTFVFDFDGGHDVVTDFTDGVDLIDVSALAFTGFAPDIQPFMIQSGADVVIDLSYGALTNTITIESEVVASIDASDFIF
ncbi:calcium-binding protein [Mesobacterium pallidum]|uniref:calcium-binding protein n=1 Tax=Mesobacterium pallidum TaxID=2872037 RepID=UPI001EE2D127|nr:calcium-binding protein [Mesobacterium pallidum]